MSVLVNQLNIERKRTDGGSFDRNSLDRNCHFSVDQNFKITQNDINKNFYQLPKNNLQILAVDRKL